jgi:hypothetical protein
MHAYQLVQIPEPWSIIDPILTGGSLLGKQNTVSES